MKRSNIALIAIVGIIALIGMNGCSTYNSLVDRDEVVTKQWKQVENAYQTRMDKTKNLFEIASAGGDYEKGTLKEVIEARSKATSIQLNAENLTQENIEKFQKAQDAFGSSLGRLMAVAEQYPQLQAVQGFRDLQTQYEGMENRISTERGRFNEMTNEYNAYVRKFPRNIWAGMFGFSRKPYFNASEGAEKAPDIGAMRKSNQ